MTNEALADYVTQAVLAYLESYPLRDHPGILELDHLIELREEIKKALDAPKENEKQNN